MSMSEAVDVRAATGAPARMADVLLRSLGGCAVMLRVPGTAMAALDAEQLGMGEAQFDEVEIGPAVYRKVLAKRVDGKGERAELLVSATRILELAGTLQYASPSVLFAQAAGVMVGETLMQIVGATSSELFGQPYLYRLQLRGALSTMV
jgi:hypothetical protein